MAEGVFPSRLAMELESRLPEPTESGGQTTCSILTRLSLDAMPGGVCRQDLEGDMAGAAHSWG